MLGRTLEVAYTPEGKVLYSKTPLAYAHEGDAGLDLRIVEDMQLEGGETKLAPLGVKIALPSGTVGLLFPRSGLAVKRCISLANSVGVIDAGYRGEVKAALVNESDDTQKLEAGERVCQLVIVPFCPCSISERESLDETERGEGGFGSTGTM